MARRLICLGVAMLNRASLPAYLSDAADIIFPKTGMRIALMANSESRDTGNRWNIDTQCYAQLFYRVEESDDMINQENS